ncbi:MAG: hypothetical protein DWQ06_10860 [Calditrichaeota bacterium]|nr:MAG: hypothetical protein DWQ06_10860 [Calditrichota bacterium]
MKPYFKLGDFLKIPFVGWSEVIEIDEENEEVKLQRGDHWFIKSFVGIGLEGEDIFWEVYKKESEKKSLWQKLFRK